MFPLPSIVQTARASNAIVIGANPTGLFSAYLLGSVGIPALIIEDQSMINTDNQILLNQKDLIVFEEILLKKIKDSTDSLLTNAESFRDLNILYSHIKNKSLKNIYRPVCRISKKRIESILKKNISILNNVTNLKPSAFLHHSRTDGTIQLDIEFGNSKFKVSTGLLVICNGIEMAKTDFHTLFLFLFEFIIDYIQNNFENKNPSYSGNFCKINAEKQFIEKNRHE